MTCSCATTTWTTKGTNEITGVDLSKTVRLTGTFTLAAAGLTVGLYNDDIEVSLTIEHWLGEWGADLVLNDFATAGSSEQYVQIRDGALQVGDRVQFYLCWDGATRKAYASVGLAAA